MLLIVILWCSVLTVQVIIFHPRDNLVSPRVNEEMQSLLKQRLCFKDVDLFLSKNLINPYCAAKFHDTFCIERASGLKLQTRELLTWTA